MRSFTIIVLIVVLCSFPVLGQKNTKARTPVVWSSDANCSTLNSAEVRSTKPNCTSAKLEATLFYLTEYKGITYAMAFQQSQDFIIASVQVSNNSGEQVSVIPSRSRMGRFSSEEAFTGGGAPADSFSSLSRDKLQQIKYMADQVPETEGGIRKGLRTRDVLDEKLDRNGSMTGARITPRETPDEQLHPDRVSASLLVSRAVYSSLLQPKDLNDKEKTAGYLVFKTSAEKGFYVLFLNVGGMDFVFPIGDGSIH
jgi:hypothetical protein